MINKLLKTPLLMLAFAASFLFLFTPATATTTSDGEEEDGEEIVVNYQEIHDQGGHNRIPAFIPISATLLKTQSLVHIELLYSIENLSIKLTNLSTGQNTIFAIGNNLDGYFPITLGEGFYHLEFLVENEVRYFGNFNYNSYF
ncbi:MAG: hypothetical protein II858_01340 [Bacteroidales bacterium]|nr:hypothetical protein [Bacteroidales bacterium]